MIPIRREFLPLSRLGTLLVLLGRDFSDIRTYPPADYPGLTVLRLARQSVPEVTRVVRRLLEVFASNDCRGRLWIVERNRIGIRS
jgi:hypothetical protein